MEFKKNVNETDEEFIYRVCQHKSLIGTWYDVADILNSELGVNYNEGTYRKKYQTFANMLEANKNIISDDDAYIKKLEALQEEIRKEKIKVQTLNVERNRIDRAESRQELFYEYIGKIKETLPLPIFKTVELPNETANKEYVLTLADVHFGATYESVNNAYSPEIAMERFSILLAKTIEFVKEKNITVLKVISLGDLIQGILRMSDLQINDSTVCKALVQISRIVSNFLNELSVYCYVDYYHTPRANHTQIRPLGTKANELGAEDLEYVIGEYISDLCSNNNRIKVHLSEDNVAFIKIPIFGFNVLALHGHTVKSIDTSLRDLSMLTRTMLDYVIMGHYHNGKEVPCYEGLCNDCEILVSPSFCGSDPYSDSLYVGSKSAVKIYGFDRFNGHTETYKFVLS